jgi:hypothetical protein
VVLAVALILFPSGRVRGLASWLLVGLAGLAAQPCSRCVAGHPGGLADCSQREPVR